MMPGGFDPAIAALRAPRTKEEFFWYLKKCVSVRCEVCKGAGRYPDPLAPGGEVKCPRCEGAGRHGFHLARRAVCQGHDAPLDVAWGIYSGSLPTVLLLAARGSGKTRLVSLVENMMMRHLRITVTHMGAVENQAHRSRAYIQAQVDECDPPFFVDAGGDPCLPAKAGAVPEKRREGSGQERLVFNNGALVEWLPGTVAQASGVHNEVSVLDEVDEARPEVEEKFVRTPAGPRQRLVYCSTWSYETGTVTRIRQERPHIPVRCFCLLEALQRCAYECFGFPLPDGTRGKCPLYDEEIVGPDGTRRVEKVCGGELARRADGHLDPKDAVKDWLNSSAFGRRVELLMKPPQIALGGRAYSHYSPANDLDFDPPIRPDAPLEWTMDFNPGALMEMCSVILQLAPESEWYGPELPVWWAVDEIVLSSTSTAMVVREFARRYGPGGPFGGGAGHPGGVWVYGDRSGHTPSSATGETDYQIIVRACRGFPDFKLMILPHDANPPLVNRLNLVNHALWHPDTGRRFVRFAPRCQRARREMREMPLAKGSREKDKSQRIQLLGLSHIGDALEYWVWRRLPQVIQGLAALQRRMTLSAPSGGRVAAEARAAEPGAPAWAPGARRAVVDRTSPWSVERGGSAFDDYLDREEADR